MTRRRKRILLLLLILLAVAVLLYVLAAYILKDMRLARDAAVRTVLAGTPIVTVTDTARFTAEEEYVIIFGEDRYGQPMIAWVRGDEAEAVHADLGISGDAVRSRLAAELPDADIIRVVPGITRDNHVWEVLYRRSSDPGHVYYRFYAFYSGDLLDTYKLIR